MSDPLTIREVADRYEITLRTLRFWEKAKLIQPIREGRKRLYTPELCERIRRIILLKQAGLSLDEVRLALHTGKCPVPMATLEDRLVTMARSLSAMAAAQTQADADGWFTGTVA